MTDIERQEGEYEELAAFIDGRLSGERKARMEERLLRDEDLYEVFLETVRFREQERGAAEVIPHPRAFEAAEGAGSPALSRARRRWWPAAALAAAAVLVLLVALPRGDRSAAEWAALLPAGAPAATFGEDWNDPPWGRTRSEGGCETCSREQIAFRLGAKTVELAVALRAGDDGGLPLARGIAQLASDLELYPAVRAYEDLAAGLSADAASVELRSAAEAAGESLVRDLDPGPEVQRFAAGLWAETARLAACAGDRKLFARLARQWPEAARTPEIAARLEEIEEILEQPGEAEEGCRKLRPAFDEIFRKLGG